MRSGRGRVSGLFIFKVLDSPRKETGSSSSWRRNPPDSNPIRPAHYCACRTRLLFTADSTIRRTSWLSKGSRSTSEAPRSKRSLARWASVLGRQTTSSGLRRDRATSGIESRQSPSAIRASARTAWTILSPGIRRRASSQSDATRMCTGVSSKTARTPARRHHQENRFPGRLTACVIIEHRLSANESRSRIHGLLSEPFPPAS